MDPAEQPIPESQSEHPDEKKEMHVELKSLDQMREELQAILSKKRKERTSEDHAQTVSLVLDIMYELNKEHMWSGSIISAPQYRGDNAFPDGTNISFFPFVVEGGSMNENHHAGTFMFTRSAESAVPAAFISVECDLTEIGHRNIKGSLRAPGVAGNVTIGDALERVANIGTGIIYELMS